ncbi:MAG: VOC family protein [Gammaproteobacteria bacterium]|nr:VOC family protein [Gammaproteobacteria bacterium]
MFADDILGPVRQWGYLVKDLDEAMDCWINQLGIGPWWGYRNVPARSVVDGQESDIIMSVGLAYHQGMQIELIHQTNDANSPYRYFYESSDDAQVLQQVAYMVPDVEAAISQCQARGMHEVGRILPGPDTAYVYMSSPAMKGLAIELMPHDQGFLDEYQRCAAEAAHWNGEDPYRLISF